MTGDEGYRADWLLDEWQRDPRKVHSEDERDLMVRRLVETGEPMAGEIVTAKSIVASVYGKAPTASSAPVIVRASTITPEAVRWWWRGRLAMGKLTVLEGEPDIGKSTILLDLVARVSTGRPMPDGTPPPEGPGDVLILAAAEDGAADTIVPRLTAAGADLERVHIWRGTPEQGDYLRGFELEHDHAALEAFVNANDVRMVMVDALMAAMPGGSGTNRDPDTRRLLHPLSALAERTGAVMIVNRHHKKGGGKAIERGGGSIAIAAVARAVLAVVKDDTDETGERGLLGVVKSNLVREAEKSSTAYRIVSATVDAAGSPVETSRIEWLGQDERRIRDLLAASDDEAGGGEARSCADAIREVLADGPAPSIDAEKELRGQGFSAITIRRARERVGVTREAGTIFRDKFGGPWSWRLPEPAEDPDRRCSPSMSTYAEESDEQLRENAVGKMVSGAIEAPSPAVGAHPNEMNTYGASENTEQAIDPDGFPIHSPGGIGSPS